jgi:hypothetical protein
MNPLLAKTFSIESRELIYQLKQSPFLEELLRPVFVWGVGIGTLLLITALVAKDARLRVVALVLVLASSLVVIPYLKLRQKVDDPSHGRGAPRAKFTDLRKETRWVYLTLAGLAGGGLLWGRRAKIGPLLIAATVTGGVAGTGVGMWLEAYDAGAMHSPAGGSSRSPLRTGTATPEIPLRAFWAASPSKRQMKETESAGNYGSPKYSLKLAGHRLILFHSTTTSTSNTPS